MENNNKRVPVMTIIAAVFSGINIFFYVVLIVAIATGLINGFPDSVMIVLIFGLPSIAVTAFVFSLICRRDRIKPFWIPNLVISIILLLSAFPASCASTLFTIGNGVQRNKDERQQRIRDLVNREVEIGFIKNDMTMRYDSSSRYKEVRVKFVSMRFTLLDVTATSKFELEDQPFYGVGDGDNRYRVTLFTDYSGIKIHADAYDHQYIGGTVRAEATSYYSCDKEEGAILKELIVAAKQNGNQNY